MHRTPKSLSPEELKATRKNIVRRSRSMPLHTLPQFNDLDLVLDIRAGIEAHSVEDLTALFPMPPATHAGTRLRIQSNNLPAPQAGTSGTTNLLKARSIRSLSLKGRKAKDPRAEKTAAKKKHSRDSKPLPPVPFGSNGR